MHEACHEANAGPWYKLAERCGATIKVWRVDPETFESRVADLAALVTPATKLVAVVHVSNILGEVWIHHDIFSFSDTVTLRIVACRMELE